MAGRRPRSLRLAAAADPPQRLRSPPREGKRAESPGPAVGAVADRAGSAWPTLENEALYDAALSERGCILAVAPVPCEDGQALKNARNGKAWLLAGVGMDFWIGATFARVQATICAALLAALKGEDWLDDAGDRVAATRRSSPPPTCCSDRRRSRSGEHRKFSDRTAPFPAVRIAAVPRLNLGQAIPRHRPAGNSASDHDGAA